MQPRTRVLGCLALALPLLAVPALASETELTAAVQLRTGPSDSYPAVKRLAKGLGVDVHGCLQTWDWCDVEWRGARGWVPAQVVEFQRENRRLAVSRYGTTLGVPVIGFSLAKYWDANYKNDPWYGERDRWMQRSARLESGGLLENAVEHRETAVRRPQVASVPISAAPTAPPVDITQSLSTPVNPVPVVSAAPPVSAISPVQSDVTTTVTITTVTPSVDPEF